MYNKLKTISAKDLGKLAMPDFCPRCFWIERHIGKPPGIFPGIFSTLDAVTRRSVDTAFAKNGKLPDWLPVKDAAGVEPGDPLFKVPLKKLGWVLVGKPDNIFRLKNNTYHIVDYKTAKFTGRQDELFPMYEIQLNAYALLIEAYGLEPISKLSLVYCEPNDNLENPDDFRLRFSINSIKVKKNIKKVKDLLSVAREILDGALPKPSDNCQGICGWAGDYESFEKRDIYGRERDS